MFARQALMRDFCQEEVVVVHGRVLIAAAAIVSKLLFFVEGDSGTVVKYLTISILGSFESCLSFFVLFLSIFSDESL